MPADLYYESPRSFRQTIPDFQKSQNLRDQTKHYFSNTSTIYCDTVCFYIHKKDEKKKTKKKRTKQLKLKYHSKYSSDPIKLPS